MPRAGPIYTLPEAPFVPNTAIVSADVNSDFDDIADALTASLARDGSGGMTGALQLIADGFTYVVDPNTGMHRTAADTQAIECGGTDVVTITSTGISVAGTLAVSGAFTVGGAALLPVGLGPLPWSGLTAPTKWLLTYGQTLLRADYPDLWTFAAIEIAAGNTLYTNGNGSTTFTVPDMRGYVPAGKDNMGGSAASRLTATTMTPSGQILGAVGGAQTVTLATANLPAQTPSGTITNGTILATNVTFSSTANGGQNAMVTSTTGTSGGNLQSALNLTQNSSTFAGTAFAGQVATPVNKVQPTIITNYILYAGV